MSTKEPPVIDIKEFLREKKLPNLLSPNLPSWLLTKYNIQGIDINSLQRGGSSSPVGTTSTVNSPIADLASPTRPVHLHGHVNNTHANGNNSANNTPRYHPYIHKAENHDPSKSRYEIRGKSVIVKLKLKNNNNKSTGLGISTLKANSTNSDTENSSVVQQQVKKEEDIFKAKKIHWVNLARDKKHEAENKRNGENSKDTHDYWIMTYLESILLFLVGFQYEQNPKVKLVNFKDLVPLITFLINLLEKEKGRHSDKDRKDMYSHLIGLLSLVSLITSTKIREISIKTKAIDLNQLIKIESHLIKLQNSVDRYLSYDTVKTKFPNLFDLRAKSIAELNMNISQRPSVRTKNLFYMPFNNLNMEVNNLIQFGINFLVEWSDIYKLDYRFSHDGSNHSKRSN